MTNSYEQNYFEYLERIIHYVDSVSISGTLNYVHCEIMRAAIVFFMCKLLKSSIRSLVVMVKGWVDILAINCVFRFIVYPFYHTISKIDNTAQGLSQCEGTSQKCSDINDAPINELFQRL